MDHRDLAESQLGLIRAQFSQLNETARSLVKDIVISSGERKYGGFYSKVTGGNSGHSQ